MLTRPGRDLRPRWRPYRSPAQLAKGEASWPNKCRGPRRTDPLFASRSGREAPRSSHGPQDPAEPRSETLRIAASTRARTQKCKCLASCDGKRGRLRRTLDAYPLCEIAESAAHPILIKFACCARVKYLCEQP